ncbi:type II toxin-antitoxin system PemK/MazF family toxin [Pengzhenrongella sp.]|jgi:mRNA interferase MazF|uniref:type II toxin-antitoxin system PemK/MazF family toxin n=1 Tax=Pengzhenrongella sp. TaxID=2888820 RepID=UPI002F958746
MRAIHLVRLDKVRPALILTREVALPVLRHVTVAPITSTIRGLATEVQVGSENGLDHDSIVTLDNVITVASADVGALIGYLLDRQEGDLTAAIRAAFDLE